MKRPLLVALGLAAFFAAVITTGLWIGRMAGEQFAPAAQAPARPVIAAPQDAAAPAAGGLANVIPYDPAVPLETPGPFQLIDHDGATVTAASLRGHYSLVFFGYTNCGELCRRTVETLSLVMAELGDSAQEVTVYFITVDPARDTLGALASYVHGLHPNIRGLTGSERQVDGAMVAFGVQRAREESRAIDVDNYIMQHPSIVFLLDREGRYKLHFPEGTPAAEMTRAIRANW